MRRGGIILAMDRVILAMDRGQILNADSSRLTVAHDGADRQC